MSYNESLLANSNYPSMSQSEWESAPFNQPDIPEEEFDLTISQSLSKDVTVCTDSYVLDNIEDTDWNEVYKEEHYTPLQLIQMYRETLEKQLESWEGMEDIPTAKRQVRKIEHLIEECKGWIDDETVIIES